MDSVDDCAEQHPPCATCGKSKYPLAASGLCSLCDYEAWQKHAPADHMEEERAQRDLLRLHLPDDVPLLQSRHRADELYTGVPPGYVADVQAVGLTAHYTRSRLGLMHVRASAAATVPEYEQRLSRTPWGPLVLPGGAQQCAILRVRIWLPSARTDGDLEPSGMDWLGAVPNPLPKLPYIEQLWWPNPPTNVETRLRNVQGATPAQVSALYAIAEKTMPKQIRLGRRPLSGRFESEQQCHAFMLALLCAMHREGVRLTQHAAVERLAKLAAEGEKWADYARVSERALQGWCHWIGIQWAALCAEAKQVVAEN